MNKETISIAVRSAIQDEKLMNKEVAKTFDTSHVFFTYLKNEKYWDKIPMDLWADLRTWMYSGKKLKGYKVPEKNEPESDDVQQNQEANRIMTEQIKEKIAEKHNLRSILLILRRSMEPPKELRSS